MIRCLVEDIENFVEDCKEKEYVVYSRIEKITGTYKRNLFTKKQLLQFMKDNELCEIDVFKIKDEVKINKTFEIAE